MDPRHSDLDWEKKGDIHQEEQAKVEIPRELLEHCLVLTINFKGWEAVVTIEKLLYQTEAIRKNLMK